MFANPLFCNMKFFSVLSALLLTVGMASAQSYWQQKVDTKIDVLLDDTNHVLHAFETLTYTNNSPDTLKFLFFHLWPNGYKHDHTAFAKQYEQKGKRTFYYAKPEERGYIDSLDFLVDGQSVEFYSAEETPDIARVQLNKPLLPGQTITISTPFKVKIPIVFSRLGHSGQAYYISQWFPKPAVYDRKGWHAIPYLDLGEFYSEYGSYDVSITLPQNYVLMATGNCVTESENKWLDSLAYVDTADLGKVSKILPKISDTFPNSSKLYKTVRFKEDDIHDFAWFADKRWMVRKDTVMSAINGHVVSVYTAFSKRRKWSWKEGDSVLKETVRHYGHMVGEYPYNTIKAVEGDMKAGGGMEYPTITIIDNASAGSAMVLVHEAGHNWFYGILGSNEREHTWMDEGLNSFYENKVTKIIKKDSIDKGYKGLSEFVIYMQNAVSNEDQAIEQNADQFNAMNYGIDNYYKFPMMLRVLEEYMGEADFAKGMHTYFNQWKFKHPYPEDFRAVMEASTNKNLSWFFDTVMHTDKPIDFKVKAVNSEGSIAHVRVKNKTGVAMPLVLAAYKEDSLLKTIIVPPFTSTTQVDFPVEGWTSIRVANVMPDAKSENNMYDKRRLFKTFGLSLGIPFGVNRELNDKMYISPMLRYNIYDGFSPGIVLHNITVPETRFRYVLTPMYSFNSEAMVGSGSIGYISYPKGFVRELMLQVDGRYYHLAKETENNVTKYAGYSRISPGIELKFNTKNHFTSSIEKSLLAKAYFVTEEILSGISSKSVSSQYGLLRYEYANSRLFNPYGYKMEAHGNKDFTKLILEGTAKVDYNRINKALYVRAFLGFFFNYNADPTVTDRYKLNASYNALNDYLYEGNYIGRSEVDGIGYRQISMQEGGFKVPLFNAVNRSDSWMASINMSTDLPKLPTFIKLFFDAGIIPNTNKTAKDIKNTVLLYDAGIEFRLAKNVCSIYLPIIMSSDMQNYLTNTYGRKNIFNRSVSFTFDLQHINILRAPRTLLKSVNI